MQILDYVCLLVTPKSVLLSYKKIFSKIYLGISFMDFDSMFKLLSFDRDFCCGFLIIGCFRNLVNLLGLFIMFYFGVKILQFSIVKFRSFTLFLNGCNGSCNCVLVNLLNNSNPPMIETSDVVKETVSSAHSDKGNGGFDEEFDVDKQEQCDEDEVFDVMSLRRLVKMERRRASDAYLELEKERMASTTSSEEAMAMILRLQNERNAVEMEAHQQRRLAHEKQLHDQEVIQSLRWIVMKHESERCRLEDSLRLCKQRVKLYMNCDDGQDGFEGINGTLSYLDDLDDALISSLDLGLSP